MGGELQRAKKIWTVAVFSIFLWALVFFLALNLGAVDQADSEIIAQIRVPRVLLASAIGMGLAISGAVLQILFSNPLCEPYVLGISSGSTLGAVLGATLGLPMVFSGISGSAFVGAIVFAAILYAISMRPGQGPMPLLLAGVMLGFLGSSLVSLWMALADPSGLQGAIVWLLGDLSRARPEGAVASFSIVLLLSILVWFHWRGLDALLLGEETAKSLGVDTDKVRRKMVFLVSLIIGASVSAGGMIGFVGLVVPHFSRRLTGSRHFALLPICAILGAASLTLADCLARVVARPYELPVGVVTALMGAPAFLWILLRRRA